MQENVTVPDRSLSHSPCFARAYGVNGGGKGTSNAVHLSELVQIYSLPVFILFFPVSLLRSNQIPYACERLSELSRCTNSILIFWLFALTS